MKKKRNVLGSAKPEQVELTYTPGAVVIETLEQAQEALQEYDELMLSVKPVLTYAEEIRKAATGFAKSTLTEVIPVEGGYWRKQQRFSRVLVETNNDIPKNAPKGTKSLRSLCKGLTITRKGKEMPLWNFITVRVVDRDKLAQAVSLGAISEKKAAKAFLETPQAAFIQRYEGEAKDED